VRLILSPCLPADWPGYTLEYRYRRTHYRIEVIQDSEDAGPMRVHLDGELQPDASVPLLDDGRPHRVEATMAGERRQT
jgi:cellobiose phosphorylase